jgi:hypothetical protein
VDAPQRSLDAPQSSVVSTGASSKQKASRSVDRLEDRVVGDILSRFYEEDDLSGFSVDAGAKKRDKEEKPKLKGTPGPGAYHRDYPMPGPYWKQTGRPQNMVPGESSWTPWASSIRLQGGPDPGQFQYTVRSPYGDAYRSTRYGVIKRDGFAIGMKNQAAIDNQERLTCKPVVDYVLPDTMAQKKYHPSYTCPGPIFRPIPQKIPKLPSPGPGEHNVKRFGDPPKGPPATGKLHNAPRWSLFPRTKNLGFRTGSWTPDTFSTNQLQTYA